MRTNHPKSAGQIITILLKPRVVTLILCYIFGTIFLISLFSFVYWLGDFVIDDNRSTQGFWACMYFSTITQSTLGYGDLSPEGYGRLFATFQTILGGLYNVLFLGVIVAKLVWPPASIIISEIAVFDYYEKKFRFRFYNANRLDLCNTKYTLLVKGVGTSGDQLFHRNFRVKIQFPGHPIIESHKPWLINTEPCKSVSAESLDPSKENILCPEHLNANSILRIQIEGYYPRIGGQQCYGVKEIPAENIKCGRLALVDEIDSAGKTVKLDWNNFNSYVPTDVSECQKCRRYRSCFIPKRIYSDPNLESNNIESEEGIS